jgi:hypothetical protein
MRKRAREVRVSCAEAGHPVLDQVLGFRPWVSLEEGQAGAPAGWRDREQRLYWRLEGESYAFRLKRGLNNPPSSGDVLSMSPGNKEARVLEVFYDSSRRRTSGMVQLRWL